MSTAEELAQAIASTEELLIRYLADFDDASAVEQSPNMPNHVIWSLGHLALTMHRAAERISDRTIEVGWDPEPFAFRSMPVSDASRYPRLAEMIARYRSAYATLVRAVRVADDAALERQLPWGAGPPISARDLAIRMVFHNGTHCGQIIDLRRALGLPPVIKPPAR